MKAITTDTVAITDRPQSKPAIDKIEAHARRSMLPTRYERDGPLKKLPSMTPTEKEMASVSSGL
jgi:hypothetical protein